MNEEGGCAASIPFPCEARDCSESRVKVSSQRESPSFYLVTHRPAFHSLVGPYVNRPGAKAEPKNMNFYNSDVVLLF